jgi:hypothetical protein
MLRYAELAGQQVVIKLSWTSLPTKATMIVAEEAGIWLTDVELAIGLGNLLAPETKSAIESIKVPVYFIPREHVHYVLLEGEKGH